MLLGRSKVAVTLQPNHGYLSSEGDLYAHSAKFSCTFKRLSVGGWVDDLIDGMTV